MRTMFFYTLMAVLLAFFSLPVLAQAPIKEILKYCKVSPLPHPNSNYKFVRYCFDNCQCAISNKLYTNLQCTEYRLATQKTPSDVYAKFQLSKQNATLVAITLGAIYSDNRTDVLASVDSEGNILDTLEVAVGYVYIKQYRILADGQIIVTSIRPQQEESIPFYKFAPFVGNRIDCTYHVENGKFVLKKEQRYADKTYTYELLSDENYNLWDGDEQLLNE